MCTWYFLYLEGCIFAIPFFPMVSAPWFEEAVEQMYLKMADPQ